MNNRTTEEKQSRMLGISEAIVVALIPLVLYVAAYYFNRGFALYFGIPDNLVTVDFSRMLRNGRMITPFLLGSAIAYSTIPFVLRMPTFSMLTVALGFPLWLEAVDLLGQHSSATPENIIYSALGIFLSSALVIFVGKLILEHYAIMDDLYAHLSYPKETVFGRMLPAVSLIFMLMWGIGLMTHLGASVARQQKWFVVLVHRRAVVLGIDGDLMVTTSLSNIDNLDARKFVVMDLSQQKKITLKEEKIGPIAGSFNGYISCCASNDKDVNKIPPLFVPVR